MKNFNSLFLIKLAVILLVFIVLLFSASQLFYPDFFSETMTSIFAISTALSSIAIAIFVFTIISKYINEIKRINTIAKEASKGILHHRITHINDAEYIGEFLLQLFFRHPWQE